MTHLPLNTPIQAQHLASLYGSPIVDKPKWIVIGSEQYISSWVHGVQSMMIYALRSWDETQLNLSEECTGVYLHLELEQSWESIVPKLSAQNICVIRHGLPVGAQLREAYELIPKQYRSLLSKSDSYGILMNRISNQDLSKNPIDRMTLAKLMGGFGWTYVCDLCTYRDFGHEKEAIEQRDALCGHVWRDSLFVRATPNWSLPDMKCSLSWRVHAKQRVADGWIYTTPEGFQLGFRGELSLEEYVHWNVLSMEQKEYVYSFIHSGLLSLEEPNR